MFLTDIHWLVDDLDTAYIVWYSLNWVRCAALCILVAMITQTYALRAVAFAASGLYLAKVPLEILSPDRHVPPLPMYSAIILYIAITGLIIYRHDSKRKA